MIQGVQDCYPDCNKDVQCVKGEPKVQGILSDGVSTDQMIQCDPDIAPKSGQDVRCAHGEPEINVSLEDGVNTDQAVRCRTVKI